MSDFADYLTIKAPKEVARISICDALTFTIMDNMAFTKPTPEQIKNLRETFCINVELVEEEDNVTINDVYVEFQANYPDFANDVADYRPFCPPYTTVTKPENILIWMDNGEAKRYSYETKKLYPVYEEEVKK